MSFCGMIKGAENQLFLPRGVCYKDLYTKGSMRICREDKICLGKASPWL